METSKARNPLLQPKWVGLFIVLLGLEMWCAYAAFETIGVVTSALYWAVVITANSMVVAACFLNRPTATALVVLLALLIIPYQCLLMVRHAHVREEAKSIVAFVSETKARTGTFPEDLTSYEFKRPRVSKYIQQYSVGEQHGGFIVTYCVGTEQTSHWYSPKSGWDYYPD